jgi:hypothetical protein
MGLKRDLTLGALTMLLGGMTYVSNAYQTPLRAQDLGCPDLSECGGKASCGTPGSDSGCTINCDSGDLITCKKKV